MSPRQWRWEPWKTFAGHGTPLDVLSADRHSPAAQSIRKLATSPTPSCAPRPRPQLPRQCCHSPDDTAGSPRAHAVGSRPSACRDHRRCEGGVGSMNTAGFCPSRGLNPGISTAPEHPGNGFLLSQGCIYLNRRQTESLERVPNEGTQAGHLEGRTRGTRGGGSHGPTALYSPLYVQAAVPLADSSPWKCEIITQAAPALSVD